MNALQLTKNTNKEYIILSHNTFFCYIPKEIHLH